MSVADFALVIGECIKPLADLMEQELDSLNSSKNITKDVSFIKELFVQYRNISASYANLVSEDKLSESAVENIKSAVESLYAIGKLYDHLKGTKFGHVAAILDSKLLPKPGKTKKGGLYEQDLSLKRIGYSGGDWLEDADISPDSFAEEISNNMEIWDESFEDDSSNYDSVMSRVVARGGVHEEYRVVTIGGKIFDGATFDSKLSGFLAQVEMDNADHILKVPGETAGQILKNAFELDKLFQNEYRLMGEYADTIKVDNCAKCYTGKVLGTRKKRHNMMIEQLIVDAPMDYESILSKKITYKKSGAYDRTKKIHQLLYDAIALKEPVEPVSVLPDSPKEKIKYLANFASAHRDYFVKLEEFYNKRAELLHEARVLSGETSIEQVRQDLLAHFADEVNKGKKSKWYECGFDASTFYLQYRL